MCERKRRSFEGGGAIVVLRGLHQDNHGASGSRSWTRLPADEEEPSVDSEWELQETAPVDLNAAGTLDNNLGGPVDCHGATGSGPSSTGLAHPELEPLVLEQQKRALLSEMFGIERGPAQLERYEVMGELGRGGMGVVYAAYDARLERKVAIKQLLASQSCSAMRRRFISEAQAMAKLAHPNVATIHEISEGPDGAFIVMEYIEGLTLERWLKEERSLDERVAALCEAGRGLAAAHAKGLIHRDFKPANVMVGDEGRVRVMDFGLASYDPQHIQTGSLRVRAELPTRPDLTHKGAVIGTPAYMAPEQLRGRWADARSDQFAFCVTLYQAVYGQRPFIAPNMPQLLRTIEMGEFSPRPSQNSVPTWLHELMCRGLRSDPSARFPSMDALLAALERGSLGGAAPQRVVVVHDDLDKLEVLRVCAGLLDHGVRCWFDMWELGPEEESLASTVERLREAPAVLICEGRGSQDCGVGAEHPELREALAARVEADPSSVHRLALLGTSQQATGQQRGVEPLTLDVDGDDRRLAELAARIGVDQRRSSWLAEEARSAGLSPAELSPYQGLGVFGESDARWMFGREGETEELLGHLRGEATRFLTLAGASGSGKSSLVLAGLCPALRCGALAGPAWRIAVLRPGARPCEALALALVELSPGTGVDPLADVLQATQLREQLLASPEAAGRFLRLLASATREGSRVLLVVDQFEEVFTEARLGQAEASTEAEAFVDNLLEACTEGGPVWVVTTWRADFIPRGLEVPALARALKVGTYFALPPMSEAQLRAAIVRPARRVGFEVEPRLVETLVVAAAGRAGQLPLLQHLLRELWQRRDTGRRVVPYSAYAEAGGLEGAIAVAAERALALLEVRLGDDARRITRRVMMRLVHLGDGEAGHTRRRMSAKALGCDDVSTRLALETFVCEARVLVATELGGEEIIEIAHEALLREWSTLVAWLEADREALRLRQELARDAVKWREHGRGRHEYLWGPSRVAEVRRVLSASSVELDVSEDTFLDASEMSAQKRRRRLYVVVGTLIVLCLLTAGLVYRNVLDDRKHAEDVLESREQLFNKRLEESEEAKRELEDALEKARAECAE